MAAVAESQERGAPSGSKLNVESETDDAATRLRDAIISGSVETVTELLNRHPDIIETPDFEGHTPLHLAVEHAKLSIIPVLLDNDANIEVVDSDGRTVLHRAARQGNVDLARLLLERGANVEAISREGERPLWIAAKLGNEPVARLLLDCAANIESVNDQTGTTALYEAVTRGDISIVQLLLDNGADADATASEKKQKQPQIPLPHRATPFHPGMAKGAAPPRPPGLGLGGGWVPPAAYARPGGRIKTTKKKKAGGGISPWIPGKGWDEAEKKRKTLLELAEEEAKQSRPRPRPPPPPDFHHVPPPPPPPYHLGPRVSDGAAGPPETIKFRDAVGRRFNFPFHLCSTWNGMEDLIRQAFIGIDVLAPLVAQGKYDLCGPDGGIILPAVWESVIQPGWAIQMLMWPPESGPLDQGASVVPPAKGQPQPPPPNLKGGIKKPTPLFEAMIRGDLELVKLLLRHGADTALKDHLGQLSLDELSEEKRKEIANLLNSGSLLEGPSIGKPRQKDIETRARFSRALPAPRHDPEKMAACRSFEVSMMEFHLDGRERRYSKSASIYELLYGIGPQGVRASERPEDLIDRKPEFTWYHIPANNVGILCISSSEPSISTISQEFFRG